MTAQDAVRAARDEGRLEGERRGALTVLTAYVELHWDISDAAEFRDLLKGDIAALPSLRELRDRYLRHDSPLPDAYGDMGQDRRLTPQEYRQDGEERGLMVGLMAGLMRGKQEGSLTVLTTFVALHWGAEVAVEFRDCLKGGDVALPSLRQLHERQLRRQLPLDAPFGDTDQDHLEIPYEWQHEGEQRSLQKGQLRGLMRGVHDGAVDMLTEFVEIHWGAETAADFREQLGREGAELPSLRELHTRHLRQEAPLPGAGNDNGAPPTDTKPGGGGT